MKPDRYRIEFRTPNSLDLAWKAWSLTHSAFGHGLLAARALELSNDYPDKDWRVARYSDLKQGWVKAWQKSAQKPTEFEHCGVKLTFREDGGINIRSSRREQHESGYAALEDHEVAALRAYFKSEG